MENAAHIKTRTQEIIFTILRQNAYIKLLRRYSSNKFCFNYIYINHIIYNKPCKIVSKFKDYLVYDDDEFLKKYYLLKESILRLYKLLNLYEKYSKIFPNYLMLREKECMYRNIRKK